MAVMLVLVCMRSLACMQPYSADLSQEQIFTLSKQRSVQNLTKLDSLLAEI